ncbi:MAG: nitroreductase family protein [Chloroflexi bacterium]|nr:nitroreductase family protein [Chloroflexota bacterium]
MDYENVLQLAKQRRSIRRFKPDPVPDEYIEQIIEVARWAPSGANTQPWDFVVVKKEELKQKIIQFIEEQRPLTRKMDLTRRSDRDVARVGEPHPLHAPVFIILVGDPRTIEAYPVYTGLQRGQSNFEASLANAFIYMHLAATSLGLGSGWVSATRNFYVQVMTKDLLGIPKELVIFDTMTLGYPAVAPPPRKVRARADVLHYDSYDTTKFRVNPLER